MAAGASVGSIRTLDDDEALAWLASNAPVTISNAKLARLWGWNDMKVSRRLKTWARDGRITRSKGSLTVTTPLATGSAVSIDQAVMAPVEYVSIGHRSINVRLAGIVLAATALSLGAIGLVLNARFAASFGQSTESAWMLAGIGLAIDVLALVLPVVAGQLWRHRRYLPAAGAWSIWLLAIGMTLMAAAGFAPTQIGDAIAGRDKTADHIGGLRERLYRLRAERSQLREIRSVATIDAELQAAQGAAGAVWRLTAGCSDVTRRESARLCEPVQRLRQARGEAVSRDAIDAQVAELEGQFDNMPAVIAGDPGAAIVSELATWLSSGAVWLTERDVQRARILGLLTLPSLAGLLFGFATLMRPAGSRVNATQPCLYGRSGRGGRDE